MTSKEETQKFDLRKAVTEALFEAFCPGGNPNKIASRLCAEIEAHYEKEIELAVKGYEEQLQHEERWRAEFQAKINGLESKLALAERVIEAARRVIGFTTISNEYKRFARELATWDSSQKEKK